MPQEEHKQEQRLSLTRVTRWLSKAFHDKVSRSSKKYTGTTKKGNVELGEFRLHRCVGKGSFGQVFVATRKTEDNGELFAVKVLDKLDVCARNQVEHTMTEREVMVRFSQHPFLLGLEMAFQTPTKLCLVSEFCGGGEMFFHLDKLGHFPEETVKFFCAQACDALVFLHKNNIIYRDLKCENMFLDVNGRIKLGDFGLSRIGVGEQSGAKTICGSVHYMAPEMILCHRSQRWRGAGVQTYGYMADWWTFGNLVFDMLVGQPPFVHPNKTIMFERIVIGHDLHFPRNIAVSADARALISALLVRDPAKRLGCKTTGGLTVLYEHPFFAGIDWELLREGKMQPPVLPSCNLAACSAKRRSDKSAKKPKDEMNSFLRNFDDMFTSTGISGALQSKKSAKLACHSHLLEGKFSHWDYDSRVEKDTSIHGNREFTPSTYVLVA